MTSVLAHPGYASTNLQSSGPTGFLRFFFSKIANPLMVQPVEKRAWNQLYAATAPGVQGGQFIGPDGFGKYRGHPSVFQPDMAAQDLDVARRLWSVVSPRQGTRRRPVSRGLHALHPKAGRPP